MQTFESILQELRFAMTMCEPIITDRASDQLSHALEKLWNACRSGMRPTVAITLGEYGDKPIGRISTIDPINGYEYSIQTVEVDDFAKWEIVQYPKHNNDNDTAHRIDITP